MTARRVLAAFAIVTVLGGGALLPAEGEARPGGGQSFGGGSRSSSGGSRSSGGSSRSSGGSSWGGSSRSSGGSSNTWSSKPSYSYPSTSSPSRSTGSSSSPGGGGYSSGPKGLSGSAGEFFFFLIVGAGFLALGVVGWRWAVGRSEQGWESSFGADDWREKFDEAEAEIEGERAEREARRVRAKSVDDAIAAIRGKDDAFSRVVFEDFLYALFTEVHTARGGNKVALLRPYLRETALRALEGRAVDAVESIVVGSMRIHDVRALLDAGRVEVRASFVANYTETSARLGEQSYYVEEAWVLSRAADAKSRPPDRARVLGCPKCGAALPKEVAAKCKYCGEPADSDAWDWIVESIEETARETRGPMLTGTTEEQGTELPTVVAEDAEKKWTELVSRDPALTWRAFSARVETVFQAFHRAWSSRDLGAVRPFLSDALFETQKYWVQAYLAQDLRNVTKDPTIVTLHAARVVSDKYFDAVTVRVFASCIDYTEDAKGAVVGGNTKTPRDYSEYWTFIRAAGRAGAPRTDPGCPSCGAPIEEINMAGTCTSCLVKVTSGEFDWVLSRIEQDDVYEG